MYIVFCNGSCRARDIRSWFIEGSGLGPGCCRIAPHHFSSVMGFSVLDSHQKQADSAAVKGDTYVLNLSSTWGLA